MDADEDDISISRNIGIAIDVLVIGVPITLTVIVVGVLTVALLPEFSIAVSGSVAILAVVRWFNRRDDDYRAKRYVQVPDFGGDNPRSDFNRTVGRRLRR